MKAENNDTSHLVDVFSSYPFELERGQDVYVYDTTGHEYIDFYGGHCVCAVGHSRKELVTAIAKQAEKFLFYSNLARIPIREEGAARLVQFANNGLTKVFFCNSGGEANENAIKISIKLTGRQKVIGFSGGFHGRTMLAIGATDHPDWHEYLHAWLGPNERIKPNDEAGLAAIDKETACVILEPIQSIGGVTVFEPGYLKKLRDACDKAGAFLVFDEVQTAMGRTGSPFVSGYWGTTPDMMTLAKGLAGGFAIGSVVMKPEIANELKVGDIAATFGGGPMAMAAMIATIDCIEKDNLVKHASAMEQYVRTKFLLPQIKEIRGRGLLLGLVLDRQAKPVQQGLFKKNIITGPNSNPNLLHLLPPLTIQEKHFDKLKTALSEVLLSEVL